jgi:phospholipid-translocating ATPase
METKVRTFYWLLLFFYIFTIKYLLKNRRRIWDEPIQNFGFVVDGESLAHSLREHRQLLSEVCSHCNTVVCCRMSPIQKAEVCPLHK